MTEDFGRRIYQRVYDLLDSLPIIPTDASLPVDLPAVRKWGDATADLLTDIRFGTGLWLHDKYDEVSQFVALLTQSLTSAANYLHARNDPAHRALDEALTHTYWHLLGRDCDTQAADHHFRRSGSSVSAFTAKNRSNKSLRRYSQAEHLAEGVGVEKDIAKARLVFDDISATILGGLEEDRDDETNRLWCYASLVCEQDDEDMKLSHELASSVWECGFLPCLPLVLRFEQVRGVVISTDSDLSVEKRHEEVQESQAPGREDSLEDALAALGDMVGLASVKEQVRRLVAFESVQALRRKRGLSAGKAPSRHLVLTGNPGTGKTTVARILARIFHLVGVLDTDTFIETDRSGLVGAYLGQTAIKTAEVVESAIGGMLFIDEAYALSPDDDDSYGSEAINTLLKAMEDHRSDLVVVAAGYTDRMERFLESNPGLRSRFNTTIDFPDYSSSERKEILQRCAADGDYSIEPEAIELSEQFFVATQETRDASGNGRFVRNFYEECIDQQATRLHEMMQRSSKVSTKALTTLVVQDIRLAAKRHGVLLGDVPTMPSTVAAVRKSVLAADGLSEIYPVHIRNFILGALP